ncbi:hypothetical protein [Vibrio splendidus]|uniref:hypothetical protein n=1 Tax=Vibrio splendidus TaxID=29497 RepID=UPI000C84DDF5|nr:hypothetical protein [Vibrio splendidus]PMI25548.1 hypothetical protein BCU48_23320 [Vibrio splendidus]
MNSQNNTSKKYSKSIMSILLIILGLQGIFPSFALNETHVIIISVFIIAILVGGILATTQTFIDKDGLDNKTAALIIALCILSTLLLWAIIADGYGISTFKLFLPSVIAILLFLGGALSLIYEDKQSHQNKSLSDEQKENIKSLLINAIIIGVGMYFAVYSDLIKYDNALFTSAIISCLGLGIFWYDMSNFLANEYHFPTKELFKIETLGLSVKKLLKIKSIWFTMLSGILTLLTA